MPSPWRRRAATTRLSSLTATGSTIGLQAVSTTGAQSYTGATTLNGNLNSNTAGAITVTGAATLATGAIVVQTAGALVTDDITFTSTINGAQALTLTAGAGDVLVSGIAGGGTRLTSLTASGNDHCVQAVSTTGAQSYTGATTLNGNLNSNTAGAITVTGAATLATGAIVVQTAGGAVTDDITFTSTINGAQALTLTGGRGRCAGERHRGRVNPADESDRQRQYDCGASGEHDRGAELYRRHDAQWQSEFQYGGRDHGDRRGDAGHGGDCGADGGRRGHRRHYVYEHD